MWTARNPENKVGHALFPGDRLDVPTSTALVLEERDFMSTTLGRKAALLAVYAERYALSLVFSYLAWMEFQRLWVGWPDNPGTEDAVFVEIVRHVIRLLLYVYVSFLLLLGRRVAVPPQKPRDIFVPLTTTFFYFTYNAVSWFPTSLQKSLCPIGLQTPLAAAGFLLGVIGAAVTTWGALRLGRSFGVLVVVRKVVLDGPYRWVRHPMYLGYICLFAGLVLANFSGAYFILVPIHTFLLLYRARLEEAQLAKYSADYREYMKRTGFVYRDSAGLPIIRWKRSDSKTQVSKPIPRRRQTPRSCRGDLPRQIPQCGTKTETPAIAGGFLPRVIIYGACRVRRSSLRGLLRVVCGVVMIGCAIMTTISFVMRAPGRYAQAMKIIALLILSLASPTTTACAGTINFDDAKAGEAPVGWTATKTGSGEPKWTIEKDDTAPSKPNVLKQSGVATYPVALKDDTSLKDGYVEVKFKPVSGKTDQAAGVVWRAKDADNYYIARANALEDNVTIYHTIKGKRVSFKNTDTKVASGEWHTLRVDFEGNKFTVTFDGKKVIEATDDSFSEAGKVGVWTKADSVTLFDDFTFGSK